MFTTCRISWSYCINWQCPLYWRSTFASMAFLYAC